MRVKFQVLIPNNRFLLVPWLDASFFCAQKLERTPSGSKIYVTLAVSTWCGIIVFVFFLETSEKLYITMYNVIFHRNINVNVSEMNFEFSVAS